jgi:hypothetical protein
MCAFQWMAGNCLYGIFPVNSSFLGNFRGALFAAGAMVQRVPASRLVPAKAAWCLNALRVRQIKLVD